MSPTTKQFEETVDASLAILGSVAETIAISPRSTLAPAGRTASADRFAELLQQLDTAGERVRLEELIAEGGMAAVHLATQRSLGRKVAVKTPLPGMEGTEATARLLREAWVAGSLEHPNVLPVYDAYLSDQGAPRIVLKRIDGVPWRELMHDEQTAKKRLGPGDLLEHNLAILMQVCQAAHFAHTRGILHRDLKPDNVMIGEYGEVMLIDWGIAVSLRGDDAGHFVPSQEAAEVAGTPAYMAPEMLGVSGLSERTDVYLLGGILYEILCGRPPHQAATSTDVVRSILKSTPVFDAGAPEELVSIARRALAADPAMRFASADELRISLSSYLQHKSSARLAREAERRLERLSALVESDGDPGPKRAEVAGLFGACRFGFEEALGMWPENPAAREGRERAIGVMVEHEARNGDADAAVSLLAELESPDPRLVALVGAAEQRRAAERRRIAELERLGRLFDPAAEVRARWTVTVGLTLLGTVIPLFTSRYVDPKSQAYAPMLALPTAFLALTVVWALSKRRALTQTAQNRWVIATMIIAFAGQVLVYFAGWLLGLPVVAALAIGSLLWAALAGLLAAAVEPRIFAVALGYVAAFFAIALTSVDRRGAVWILSAAHLVTTVTVFAVWRPGAAGRTRST